VVEPGCQRPFDLTEYQMLTSRLLTESSGHRGKRKARPSFWLQPATEGLDVIAVQTDGGCTAPPSSLLVVLGRGRYLFSHGGQAELDLRRRRNAELGEEASNVPVLTVTLDLAVFGLSESTCTDQERSARSGQTQPRDGPVVGPDHLPLDPIAVAVLHGRHEADGKVRGQVVSRRDSKMGGGLGKAAASRNDLIDAVLGQQGSQLVPIVGVQSLEPGIEQVRAGILSPGRSSGRASRLSQIAGRLHRLDSAERCRDHRAVERHVVDPDVETG